MLEFRLDNETLTGVRNASPEISFHFGASAGSPGSGGLQDTAIVGDWANLGFDQAGTVRQAGGALQFHLDTDRDINEEYLFQFGSVGDTPLVGNFDGANADDVAVSGPDIGGNRLWSIGYAAADSANSFPRNNDSLASSANFFFGANGDIPLVGDFNGDGRDDVAFVHDNAGVLEWSIAYANATGAAFPNDGSTLTANVTYTYGSSGNSRLWATGTTMASIHWASLSTSVVQPMATQ